MQKPIILDNYSTIEDYIVIENSNYILTNEKNGKTMGVGGFDENKELVALYVNNNELFFLHKDTSFKLDVENVECSNFYIDKKLTCFEITLFDLVIIKIIRAPIVDAKMLLIGENIEEFDILLYLKNNCLETKNLRNEFIQKYQ